MKYLIFLLLTGCASLNPLQAQLQQVVNEKVAAFDHLRHVNMAIPEVVLGSAGGDYAEAIPGTIIVNPALCEQDMDDCLNDTLPHELAHEAIFQYGAKTPIVTRDGIHIDSDGHDGIWCDTMRAFGGVPEKHGYCLNQSS